MQSTKPKVAVLVITRYIFAKVSEKTRHFGTSSDNQMSIKLKSTHDSNYFQPKISIRADGHAQ